jgi:hypothetical protein
MQEVSVMVASLQEQLGVAMTGQHWDLQDVALWQSTVPDIILFMVKQPALVKSSDSKRYQAALSQFRVWQEDHYKVTGGSFLFTLTSEIDNDLQAFQRLKEQWCNVLLNKGYKGSANPRFMPLPVRNGAISIILDPSFGKVSNGDDQGKIAAPGLSTSLMIALTELGAEEWARRIKENGPFPGSIKLTYEYPQMLPEVEGRITLHGLRVFTFLSNALSHKDDGTLYGSSDDIQAAWIDMVRSGDVEIKIVKLPPDMEARRQELLNTFASQAKSQLFDPLFTPLPDSANGASDGSLSGGTNYAFKWHKRSEADDLSAVIKFDSWNWLEGSMEVDFTTLLQGLDESYINVVYTEASVPVSVTVEPDPMVASVSTSLNFSNGRAPVVQVFGKEGGTAQAVLTSDHPDTVTIQYAARVNFSPVQWPVLEVSGAATVAQGGNHVLLRPGTWIHRFTIYMYVRDGNRIKKPNEITTKDYLVLNVTYQGADPSFLIKNSAHITPLAPVEFSYPAKPGGRAGQVKLSAFGSVGGQMIRSQEISINQDEQAVYILASKEAIQLVSKEAVMPEDDALAQRLLASGARPLIKTGQAATGPVAEAGKEEAETISIDTPLELVAQPTPVSCWVAALAMVIGARDKTSYAPETVASAAGMTTTDSYGWSDIERAVSAWGLHETGPTSAMPADWASMLQTWGPLWIVEIGAPYHAVVVAGMHGDATPGGTRVTVYNPWPPNQGAIEYKTFLDFDNEFGLGAGAMAMVVHA